MQTIFLRLPRFKRAGLWKHPDFLKLWAAGTVSKFGSFVSGTALSFTAIIMLRATPGQLSLLMIARLLPQCLAGLFAGVWTDRLRRLPLMICADVLRALMLLFVPFAALRHALRIEHFYVITALTGVLTVCFDVADRSYLPTLLQANELIEGNSKLTASASIAEFGAFALAGWLVQWLTGPIAVLVDAISFFFSALFLSRIRNPEPFPASRSQRKPFRRELFDGLAAVWHNALLRALAGSALLLGVGSGMIGTVIVAFMVQELGFAPSILGMIFAVGGITALAGAIVAEPIARHFGVGRAIVLGVLVAALGTLLVPLSRGATLLSGALLIGNQLFTDSAYTVYEINAVSLRQAVTPDQVQGRVNAALATIQLGAMLGGAFAGGILGERFGLRSTLFVGVAVEVATALWLWLSPIRRVSHVHSLS